MELTLPIRKNAQTGVTHFYPLWANDDCPELCPLRALLRLDLLTEKLEDLTGPLFLHVAVSGNIERKHRMVCLFLSFIIFYISNYILFRLPTQ